MKDIFKFRVYSPVQETLAEVAKIDYEQNMVYDVNGEGFNIDVVVLNQCTGVKDMDGTLIYVDDFLKIKPFMILTLHHSHTKGHFDREQVLKELEPYANIVDIVENGNFYEINES